MALKGIRGFDASLRENLLSKVDKTSLEVLVSQRKACPITFMYNRTPEALLNSKSEQYTGDAPKVMPPVFMMLVHGIRGKCW